MGDARRRSAPEHVVADTGAVAVAEIAAHGAWDDARVALHVVGLIGLEAPARLPRNPDDAGQARFWIRTTGQHR
jgi:hypothetical protein